MISTQGLMFRFITRLVIFGVCAVALVACGNSSDDEVTGVSESQSVETDQSDTSGSSASESSPTVVESDEVVEEESVEAIEESDEVVEESDVPEESVDAIDEERIATLSEMQDSWLDFEAPEFLECWLDNVMAATGVTYAELLEPETYSDDEFWDTSTEIWFGEECMSFLNDEQAEQLIATREANQESREANQEFAALSDIDQTLINALQSWDWDTQPWVSADIESINVPEGNEFSVTLTLENFTESPILAFDCTPTSAWDFFAGAQTGQQQCSPPAITTFDSDGVAVITATSTGNGACWGVGGFGFEQGFICIPFGDLDGYSSDDCEDSELGEGVLFPLSDGAYWCNYGAVSRPLDTNE